jgi:hypothetical protein
MKLNKVAGLIVLALTMATNSLAQDYTFRVLVNKGKNEMKTRAGWQQVKVGSSLRTTDDVKIVENAYLGLVHASGKALEVKVSGRYTVTELAARVKGGTSVVNKYTDFILSANTDPKNTLTATGAVSRGTDNIKVYLPRPENSVVYNDKVFVTWETAGSQQSYEVIFKSMFGDELAVMETTGNSVAIDLGDRSFVNEDNIIVTVAEKGSVAKTSDEYTLKKLSRADKDRIRTAYREIAESTVEESAINKLLIAGFYEENNLLIDAIGAYQDAIRLAPDVPSFEEAYNDFLLRNGLKRMPPKK